MGDVRHPPLRVPGNLAQPSLPLKWRLAHAMHRRLARVTEPQILFPLIAVVLLTVIGGATLSVSFMPIDDTPAVRLCIAIYRFN